MFKTLHRILMTLEGISRQLDDITTQLTEIEGRLAKANAHLETLVLRTAPAPKEYYTRPGTPAKKAVRRKAPATHADE